LPPPFVTCPYEALDGGWLMRPKSEATEQNRAHRRLPHFPGAGALRSGERALEWLCRLRDRSTATATAISL